MAVTCQRTTADTRSSLDSIETTAPLSQFRTYADYLRSRQVTEWNASALLYMQVAAIGGPQLLPRLEECRTFAWFARNRVTGKVRVMANACRLRWCPFCSRSRYNSIQPNVSDWLSKRRSPKLLTLTVSHSVRTLREQISSLYAAFRHFRKLHFFKRSVRGGIWFFQVKRSKNLKQWHPHFHILLDADYIDQHLLSAEWFKATGTSFVVDIRKVRTPAQAAAYVSRYVARPANLSTLPPDDHIELYNALNHRRLCGSFGTASKVMLRPQSSPDRKEWIRVGSWIDVTAFKRCPDKARLILAAWINGTPLDADVAMPETVMNSFITFGDSDIPIAIDALEKNLTTFL